MATTDNTILTAQGLSTNGATPVSTTPNTNPAVSTAKPNPATVNATPTQQDPNAAAFNAARATGTAQVLTPSGSTYNATPTAQTALQQAQASGPAPQTAGEASPKVQAAMAPVNQAADQVKQQSNIQTQLQNDPGYQKLLADSQNISNVTAQQTSLLDTYKQMETDAGLPALNTQLLNTQKIINGTEDDIRNEVQAANGFATNSQVMALASARNKTLIQNYNNLLATKTEAESHISTMMNLVGQDRASALAAANSQFQIDTQLQDYKQKFTANAQEAYKNVIDAVGYSGLVNSLLNTDPTGQSLSQAEQLLGFQPGQLQQIVTQKQNATNLATIQAAGITSPYTVDSNGQVMNSQTGYTYQSQEDFKAKTGMDTGTAGAKGLIQKLGLPIEQQTKIAQLSKAQTDAKYADAQAQADIVAKRASAAASGASAAASAASAAKNNYDLNFEKNNGGMTPTEANAQGQKLLDTASSLIEKMNTATNPMSWDTAWASLHTQFPDASTQTLDSILQSDKYRK